MWLTMDDGMMGPMGAVVACNVLDTGLPSYISIPHILTATVSVLIHKASLCRS